jgi:rhomboid domain-containing protein 1
VPWDKWDVCLSAREVMKGRDYKRLFLSAFEHGDDMHLYYNMLSFLIKGRSLEKKMGSKNFLCTLALLTTLTSCYYVGIGWAMHHFTNDNYYVTVCAVGFSGKLSSHKGTQYQIHKPFTICYEVLYLELYF